MVPFMDLNRTHQPLRQQLTDAFHRVVDSSHFIQGPDVAALERELAPLTGTSHVIGVSSGTDALLAALMALDVGPGDDVLVPTLTFYATAGAVVRLGARPIFVDVDPQTLLMDVDQALAVRTPNARVVVPVHLFGQCVEVAPLLDAGLVVVEDAAQSLGATNAAGTLCGAQSQLACFSFFPTKPLGGFGDGGLVTSTDPALGERVRLLRTHGAKPKFHHNEVGGNFRLDTLHAALLRIKLPHLEAWATERRRLRTALIERLAPVVAAGMITPLKDTGGTHVVHQHVVRAQRRTELRASLTAQGIGTAIYYPEPLHTQPCFADLKPPPLAVAELACTEVLALPCFPGLTDDELDAVAEAIRGFYAC